MRVAGATPLPDLAELRAGSLEGLTRDDMVERYPHFLERGITGLADFSEFGGESYNEVQQRARGLFAQLASSTARRSIACCWLATAASTSSCSS